MTFATPWFLLLLLALPILLLLARRAGKRRPVVVASLLVWKRLGLAPEPPVEHRRQVDLRLLLALAAAALAAVGAAGPEFRPAEPDLVLPVLVDDSPSAAAFSGRIDETLAALADELPAGARLDVRRSPNLADLAAVLGEGPGDVVAVTDAPPEAAASGGAGRVRVALVGEPVANAGVVAAFIEPAPAGSADAPRYGAVVRSFAGPPREIVAGPPGAEERTALPAGATVAVGGPAPAGRAAIRIEPGDRFSFDDAVEVAATAARGARLSWRGPDAPRLRLALELAGVRIEPEAPDEIAVRVEPGPRTRLLFAPPGPPREAAGAAAAGPALPPDAAPHPATSLGPLRPPEGVGEVLLADREGPLVLDRGDRIDVAFDPTDPACGIAADPAFPILAAALSARLGAQPAGWELSAGVVDPAESAARPEGGPLPRGPFALRPAGEAPAPRRIAPLFFGLAAAALAARLALAVREGRRAAPAARGGLG